MKQEPLFEQSRVINGKWTPSEEGRKAKKKCFQDLYKMGLVSEETYKLAMSRR